MNNLEHKGFPGSRLKRYAPLILWIGVIFFLSSNAGSASNTSLIIRPLMLWLFPDITDASLETVHFFVRKTAHFTEYGILSLLTLRTFKGSTREFLRRWGYPLALLVTAAVAACDETNQSFLASRTGQPQDVLLDLSGGTFMVLVFYLLTKLWPKSQGKNSV